MCVLGKQETLLLYTIGENHHLTRFDLCSPFNSFEYPDIFGICVIKQKCLVFSKYS